MSVGDSLVDLSGILLASHHDSNFEVLFHTTAVYHPTLYFPFFVYLFIYQLSLKYASTQSVLQNIKGQMHTYLFIILLTIWRERA